MPISPAQRRRSLQRTFLRCFLLAFAMYLPFLIIDQGFFLYCGDFNSQQIPFQYYMQGMVREGSLNYSWATDLGSGFIESYSFYLLGSPFFWLMCLFPQAWAPYLIVPFLCLKFAVAGTGATLWARRYTRTTYAAELVGILYAFSGYTLYNFFFHFTDMIALFPLLLWSIDEFFDKDRRCVFALMTALCLLTNYFFFVSEVVFIFIYFIFKLIGQDWKLSAKKFGLLVFEALLGVGLTMVLTLPSFLSVMANPRVDNFSSGFDLLIYWRTQQYLAIFTSAFLPPDPPYLPNLFTNASVKWTSMSLYLPLTGMAGVLTWLKTRKKHTFSRLLITCAVMAFVPVLNSAFYAFNSSYYCRWYFMPLLVMGLVTVLALEESPREEWLRSLRVCGIITAAYLLFTLVPERQSDGSWQLGVEEDLLRHLLTVGLALGAVALLYYCALRCRSRAGLLLRVTAFAAMFGVVLGIYTIACGKFPQREGDADYKSENYEYRNELAAWLDAADENYYRIDSYNTHINLGMWLNRSCLQFFSTTVDASIMDFYPMVGVKRDVSSKPDISSYALRGLLNVKYMLVPTDELTSYYENEQHPEDWVQATTIGPFAVLEYQQYVPFGTTYDYYLTTEQYESLTEDNRSKLLLRALVLDETQIALYGDLLQPLPEASLHVANYAAYLDDCEDRRAAACSSFVADGDGFTAEITTENSQLVFFAVPYNEGWHATVNGETVPVENVDSGLCAVKVGAGESTIQFVYETPGLAAGLTISLVCLAVFWCYVGMMLLLAWKKQRSGCAVGALPVLEMTPAEEADALPHWQPESTILENSEDVLFKSEEELATQPEKEEETFPENPDEAPSALQQPKEETDNDSHHPL